MGLADEAIICGPNKQQDPIVKHGEVYSVSYDKP